MNEIDALPMSSTATATLEGGGKVLRRRKGPKGAKKKTAGKKKCPVCGGKKKKKVSSGKKTSAAAVDGKSEWRRMAQKVMYAGEMRSVWRNKTTGEHAVRRMKVAPSGAKKYFYRRI